MGSAPRSSMSLVRAGQIPLNGLQRIARAGFARGIGEDERNGLRRRSIRIASILTGGLVLHLTCYSQRVVVTPRLSSR